VAQIAPGVFSTASGSLQQPLVVFPAREGNTCIGLLDATLEFAADGQVHRSRRYVEPPVNGSQLVRVEVVSGQYVPSGTGRIVLTYPSAPPDTALVDGAGSAQALTVRERLTSYESCQDSTPVVLRYVRHE
jgi:hypothetical protein